jgi:hypothetical protein
LKIDEMLRTEGLETSNPKKLNKKCRLWKNEAELPMKNEQQAARNLTAIHM